MDQRTLLLKIHVISQVMTEEIADSAEPLPRAEDGNWVNMFTGLPLSLESLHFPIQGYDGGVARLDCKSEVRLFLFQLRRATVLSQ